MLKRIKKDRSLRTVAAELGISHVSVQLYLQGEVEPKSAFIRAAIEARYRQEVGR